MTPAFYRACLQREHATAETVLGLRIPQEWYEEQWVMRLRLQQLQQDSTLQPWLLRAIALREQRTMIGHIGFHSAPGAEYLSELAPGAVEFGYTVFAPFRRQGHAREACAALMQWARLERHVTRFIVSIRPDNIASRGLAAQFGFERIGSHIDEIDGLEDIYALHTNI